MMHYRAKRPAESSLWHIEQFDSEFQIATSYMHEKTVNYFSTKFAAENWIISVILKKDGMAESTAEFGEWFHETV
jgi:hypothetical protein